MGSNVGKCRRTELVEIEDKENNEVVETLSDANMTEITKALSAAFVEIHDSSMAIVEVEFLFCIYLQITFSGS